MPPTGSGRWTSLRSTSACIGHPTGESSQKGWAACRKVAGTKVVLLGIRDSARQAEEKSSCWGAGETSNCYILLLGTGVVVPSNLLPGKGVEGCRYLRMTVVAVAGAAAEEGGSSRGWL